MEISIAIRYDRDITFFSKPFDRRYDMISNEESISDEIDMKKRNPSLQRGRPSLPAKEEILSAKEGP